MMSPVVTIGLSISVLMVIGESAHPVVEQKNNKQTNVDANPVMLTLR
jgi:hypothetical protein